MADIYVPELGESVADATVGKWLKQEGDAVKSGEAVVELETDKINFEVEAEEDGVLESIASPEGETVNVGDVIGSIGAGSGEAGGSDEPEDEPGADAEGSEPAGDAGEKKPRATFSLSESRGDSGGNGSGSVEESNGEYRASPSVKKLAAEYDIDLASISAGGRVTKEDVERAIREKDTPSAPSEPAAEQNGGSQKPAAQPAASSSGREDQEERIKFSRRRQTIAKRLVESQQTAAMLTTFNEVDMSAVMDLRRRRKDDFNERTGARLGFMSFFTKAAVAALKAHPDVNAELQETELVRKHYYDIGVAVSTDEGLVVPVVRDADRRSFAEIEGGIADLAVKARDGKLSLADLSGGTFTITNGGIFGSLLSTPILTMPQVAILGMHKIQEKPVVVDGEVVVRPMMYLALSYDHRVIDGREAVTFLVKIKELIEDPESLLLEG
ncbi:2-oxoglutarate dehydrogenase complex dihydrolipoyllysine-residue succinyltransferase [Rubrobacter indicoceani]|uniref:2-oxoglutarate dehydrogenase complex dihydrolipoyllysine-residue succinyltransferase n=1 Tax=Rubrobacter indicoceani TaxID=2051957 RepID=UPI000E5AEBD6|nr:2-oxoglutarate dehydrogenase complex dihydrolipoyllysine-residue succinyltransferase [Rubrobacter indicoceani]